MYSRLTPKQPPHQITVFNDWEKRTYPLDEDRFLSLYGAGTQIIDYHHPHLERKLTLQFYYGMVEIFFSAKELNLETAPANTFRLDELKAALNKPYPRERHTKLDIFENAHYSLKTHTFCWESFSDYSRHTVHHLTPINDMTILEAGIRTMAEIEHFPAEMMADILKELQSSITYHKNLMGNLTTSLLNQDKNQIRDIQSYLTMHVSAKKEISKTEHPLLNYIIQQMLDGNLYDALLWCDILPEEASYYVEFNRAAAKVIMQLKYQIDHSSEKGTEVTFPAHEKHGALFYEEALFKFAWKAAQKSRKPEDVSFAMRVLSDISGGSGFEKIFSDSSHHEADVLIEYARNFKELREENKELKKRLALLQVGMFRPQQVDANEKNEEEVQNKLSS